MNKEVIEGLRSKIEQLGDSAVRALAELIEMGESESVRLAAASKALDLIGVKPPVEIVTNVAEVDRVNDETAATLERLEKNLEARKPKEIEPALETLFVLESEDPEVVEVTQ